MAWLTPAHFKTIKVKNEGSAFKIYNQIQVYFLIYRLLVHTNFKTTTTCLLSNLSDHL